MEKNAVANTPENTKKLRERKGKIVKAVQETIDTWTLYVEVPAAEREYLAGQFVSIDPHQFAEFSEIIAYLEHVKNKKESVRAYSLASVPHEELLMITTKPERFDPNEMQFPPLLSPLLASNILVGREIAFLGYSGAYVLKPDHGKDIDEVLHFVAGSGVVPNFALLKDELINNKNSSVIHIMVNVNKTYEDIIYRKELDELQNKYPSRFKLYHFLTREENFSKYGSNYYGHRPTTADIREFLHNPEKILVYSCGSAITKWQKKTAKETGVPAKLRFLESVTQIVDELGVDKKRFKKEVYG
ncbi:MAG: oxidoreductase [bacterium]|nr:oxidoreductase [bacterium]